MAIQTWLGMGCKITAYNSKTHMATILCDDGERRERHISELRADNGIREIQDAIDSLNKGD